ncbi:hypothetical protein SAMD00019534_065700 [Acytostelium subglobosum LB1]|uniref:hypothetical protein n=1 Tax=Acytostelium subglobosum LB1 TaxID=1410327 RepID=UPI00064505D7|nr:hypothetical protein SAMD00019534_065700 [Acytostelium subglobosum LB1]GAM23395.1 hypothetical protein SAMD00019534_065700 [Acytostelium subglobosum LB1]|eukprot:XP_012753844.1 hypothetical protein SAMD00019534_065700 [Acytostelium subglobosum LB1]
MYNNIVVTPRTKVLAIVACYSLFICVALAAPQTVQQPGSINYSTLPAQLPIDELKAILKNDIKDMFYHGYDCYMKYAFPMDELKSLSCKGSDTFGKYALTYIDTLVTLLVVGGNTTEFEKGVKWLSESLTFDKDMTVSVFETNIRILGGLLSAHLYAEKVLPDYKGVLLPRALDIGERLLVAFDTPTGIPYGSVNLRKGVSPDESKITCTAGGGTFALEFGILSRLTGRPEFDKAAKRAAKALWKYRSMTSNLFGNHINVFTGQWESWGQEASIGNQIDSYFEYMLKAALYFDDQEYMDIFVDSYKAIIQHTKKDDWYVLAHMNNPKNVQHIYSSLQAFWPGLQVLAGQLEDAYGTTKVFHSVWRKYGFTPESYNHNTQRINQKHYPLRPELAESIYYMYTATKDPLYINMIRDLVWTLKSVTRTKCGHAGVLDVEAHTLDDKMESFFLAELCKYLYLTVDDNNMVGNETIVFTTEAHVFPMQHRFLSNKSTGKQHRPTSKGKSKETDIFSKEFNWKCKPESYLRDISAGPMQLADKTLAQSAPEWFEDQNILASL